MIQLLTQYCFFPILEWQSRKKLGCTELNGSEVARMFVWPVETFISVGISVDISPDLISVDPPIYWDQWKKQEMNDAISKRITKGFFTRFTGCNTKGPTRPTSLKGFLYPPICKKKMADFERQNNYLLSWFLFQPAILVYQKVFHTFLNEILPKKDWIPSSNLDMLLTKTCTSCREKKYPMTHNVFTSG